MGSCNLEWADLLVYTTKEVVSELWNKIMMHKLPSVYSFSYIYPELIND